MWSTEEYRDIPDSSLRIEAIEWTDERVDLIRNRTKRLGSGEIDIEPKWATEAAMDVYRLAGPAHSGGSLQVVGFSQSCRAVLKVWLYPKDLEAGAWYGASACLASQTNQRQYKKRKEEGN